jgi:hypothetical protein
LAKRFGNARWLGEEPDPRDLVRPLPVDFNRMWPISTRVNKPENDDRSWSRSDLSHTAGYPIFLIAMEDGGSDPFGTEQLPQAFTGVAPCASSCFDARTAD